jgi:hypothetical protein
MKAVCLLVVAFLSMAGSTGAQEPAFERVGTISELMIDIIYPLSDELFYIMRAPPENDQQWSALRRSTLMLAESGNLLMMPGRAIQQDDWMAAAKRLIDVSTVAFEATKAQDLQAILDLSPELEASCRGCHEAYHPRYRRRQQGR